MNMSPGSRRRRLPSIIYTNAKIRCLNNQGGDLTVGTSDFRGAVANKVRATNTNDFIKTRVLTGRLGDQFDNDALLCIAIKMVH